MIVKPKEGTLVRDPITKRFISTKGHVIGEPNRYWINRLRDGDIVEIAAIEADDLSDAVVINTDAGTAATDPDVKAVSAKTDTGAVAAKTKAGAS